MPSDRSNATAPISVSKRQRGRTGRASAVRCHVQSLTGRSTQRLHQLCGRAAGRESVGLPGPEVEPVAITERPGRTSWRPAIFSATINAVAPKIYEVVMNTAFELFPDSAAAKGIKGMRETAQPSNEQIAFASLMRGVHW